MSEMAVSRHHPAAAQPMGLGRLRAFPKPAVLLHWLSALLVLALFVTGVLMKQIGEGALVDALYTFHKTAGATLFLLVLGRLAYRLLAQIAGRWRRGAGSRLVHGLIYACLVAVPLLGLAGVSDFGARGVYFGLSLPGIWREGAGDYPWLFLLHAWLAFGMIALVGVHIGLALSDYIQRGGHRALAPAEAFADAKSASPAAADMP